jgi:hypothetical protein
MMGLRTVRRSSNVGVKDDDSVRTCCLNAPVAADLRSQVTCFQQMVASIGVPAAILSGRSFFVVADGLPAVSIGAMMLLLLLLQPWLLAILICVIDIKIQGFRRYVNFGYYCFQSHQEI